MENACHRNIKKVHSSQYTFSTLFFNQAQKWTTPRLVFICHDIKPKHSTVNTYQKKTISTQSNYSCYVAFFVRVHLYTAISDISYFQTSERLFHKKDCPISNNTFDHYIKKLKCCPKCLEQRSNGRVFSLIRTKMLGLHKHSRKLVKPERVRSNLMHRTHSATNLASYPFPKKTENHKKGRFHQCLSLRFIFGFTLYCRVL